MEKVKRLIVAVVILAVIVVMALRGCPRTGRRADTAPRIVVQSASESLSAIELKKRHFLC